MEYKGYLGKVEFDDEAQVFHGEVINIRDVITFEGTSVEELQRAFEDLIYTEIFMYDHEPMIKV
jgi:predicted HicB family RNase H-like nuclease